MKTKKYIDAESVLSKISQMMKIRDKPGSYEAGLAEAYNFIKEAEVTEVPDVIKCTDCMYYHSGVCERTVSHVKIDFVKNTKITEEKLMGFCSEGKRFYE